MATIKRLLMGVAMLAAASSPAGAQYTSSTTGFTWNNPISASLDTMISQSITRAVMFPDWPRTAAAGKGKQVPQRRVASSTTFTPGQRSLIDRIPEERRAQARQIFPVCDRLYAQAMRDGAGLTAPADLADLASSTTFYLELSRSIASRGDPQASPRPSPTQVRNLRERMRAGYLASGAFAGKTDAEKQLNHDALVLAACLPALQWLEAEKKNDEPAKQNARLAATRLLARFGLSPRSFHYRSDGTVEITPSGG